jgi:hypothetical protein
MSASARSGGAALFGAAALQIHRGFGRLGGSGEQRPLIAVQEREPLRKVLRVVGPRFLRDRELRAQERGADLGDELLGGIGVIAPKRLPNSRSRRCFAPAQCVSSCTSVA